MVLEGYKFAWKMTVEISDFFKDGEGQQHFRVLYL
jgi:hypothetical protein